MKKQSMDQWLTKMHETDWNSLSPRKRLKLLQELENIMAETQGRKPMKVRPFPAQVLEKQPGVMGCQNKYGIFINPRYLEGGKTSVLKQNQYSVAAAINTVLHEGRHAWQDHVLTHSEAGANDTTRAILLLNNRAYIRGGAGYSAQFVELDARRYARRQYDKMMRRMKELGWEPDPVYIKQRERDRQSEESRAAQIKSAFSEEELALLDILYRAKIESDVKKFFPNADLSAILLFEEAKKLVRGEITVDEFVEGKPMTLTYRDTVEFAEKEKTDALSFEDSFWAALDKPDQAKPKAEKPDDISVRPIGKGSGF